MWQESVRWQALSVFATPRPGARTHSVMGVALPQEGQGCQAEVAQLAEECHVQQDKLIPVFADCVVRLAAGHKSQQVNTANVLTGYK